jgi:hypothetical protein
MFAISGAALLACSLSSYAYALTDEPGGPGAAPPPSEAPPAPPPPIAPAPPPPASAPEVPVVPSKPDSRVTGTTPPEGGGLVFQQLPASAYPEGNGRGLYGGSLWFSPFHGLQWPYMPRTGMGFSGYVWLDPGYASLNRGDPNQQSIRRYLQQGRFVLRVSPTYSDGRFFIQGVGETVLNKEQNQAQPFSADTDDVSLRVGYWNRWDIQLGRFDVWEVYHLGMGLDINTLERGGASDGAADLYGVTFTSYKEASSGKNTGNIALHYYPLPWLRGETLGQMGGGDGYNTAAGRQAVIYDLGWLKVKGAAEYLRRASEAVGGHEVFTRWGGGGGIIFILSPWAEFGFNGAYASVKHTANDGSMDGRGTYSLSSIGGFANVRLGLDDLLLGVGVNRVSKTDQQAQMVMDANGNTVIVDGQFDHLQTFAALQYLLAKQLFLKLVVGYAESYSAPTYAAIDFNNYFKSVRLRATYLF